MLLGFNLFCGWTALAYGMFHEERPSSEGRSGGAVGTRATFACWARAAFEAAACLAFCWLTWGPDRDIIFMGQTVGLWYRPFCD